ncbi:NUDIX hydrolase [Companilactobacillus musae]|uniref:NUDIX hydrolase n=1 Tax=Companilactobacillus musae TaxID=1903258 RepID=UPI000E65D1E6|nr:NUDIX hydrolase [Companilactobacillus musae]
MANKTFHTAFGVYGIIEKDKKLLVIEKNGGPYINRYDLPGGSLDQGEGLSAAVRREILEETGIKIKDFLQLGTVAFRYPWKYQRYTWNEHICVFYLVKNYEGNSQSMVSQFVGQDSLGSGFIDLNNLNINNSSPLVLLAKKYIVSGVFETKDISLNKWDVL